VATRGLLAIFAHPDDETFSSGGVMAMAAMAGHPVWSICATNGDEGGLADERGDHAMDPEIRIRELQCACLALGVNPPIFLG
jgi:LmbE family N-acetylglucosaminyl deacetylase